MYYIYWVGVYRFAWSRGLLGPLFSSLSSSATKLEGLSVPLFLLSV